VLLLLEHKANVDTKTVSGKTALYLAAENGYKVVVQLLLKKHGRAPNERSE
jgi:ankyrin repeat protein